MSLPTFRRLLVFLLSCLALMQAGCASGDPVPYSVPVRLLETEGVAQQPDRVGELIFKGAVVLRSPDRGIGGLSSLRVSPDGGQFIAISDRGDRVAGRLSYGADGMLAGIRDVATAKLLETDGNQLTGGQNDTESLAMIGPWPGDGWVVGLERKHRLLRYGPALAGIVPVPVTPPDGIADLAFNGGLETVLCLPDGRLLLIAEAADGGAPGLHRAWIGRSGAWVAFHYRGYPPFLPVDAALTPDGGILVLERRAGLVGGWGTRIVHVDAAALAAGAVAGGHLQGREIGRLDPPLLAENFEGIDTRTTPDGRVVIHILSDDNFFILQRTVMMMFEWRG